MRCGVMGVSGAGWCSPYPLSPSPPDPPLPGRGGRTRPWAAARPGPGVEPTENVSPSGAPRPRAERERSEWVSTPGRFAMPARRGFDPGLVPFNLLSNTASESTRPPSRASFGSSASVRSRGSRVGQMGVLLVPNFLDVSTVRSRDVRRNRSVASSRLFRASRRRCPGCAATRRVGEGGAAPARIGRGASAWEAGCFHAVVLRGPIGGRSPLPRGPPRLEPAVGLEVGHPSGACAPRA